MNNEKLAWVVYTNTDRTEGRGYQYPLFVCSTEATAKRLAKRQGVMGSDASIETKTLHMINGVWYGPVKIESPTKEDDQNQKMLDQYYEVLNRAKSLGLTKEDLAVLAKRID